MDEIGLLLFMPGMSRIGMSAAHMPLRLHGEFLGDLITVGHRVMLFTARPDLAALDGSTFDDADAAREAALARLAPTLLFRGMAA